MKPTLFWAWQSDAENSVCRGFIKTAAEKALKVLIRSGEVQDAPRLAAKNAAEFVVKSLEYAPLKRHN